MSSILSATDLSAPARHAADRAARLALANGATLTLAHVIEKAALEDLFRTIENGDQARSFVEVDARDRLETLAAQLQQRHGVSATVHLATGNPTQELARLADTTDADLVVTGTRGAGFFRGVVTGSTAERLARRSARPVLMVRQATHEPYRRVLLPVDFSPWSVEAVKLARSVAPDAELVLLHVVQVPFESRLRMSGVAEDKLVQYRSNAIDKARQQLDEVALAAGLTEGWTGMAQHEGAAPWVQIVQQEQELDCDLIVIGKHGRDVLEELLVGGTTRIVMAESNADVLVSTRRTPEAI